MLPPYRPDDRDDTPRFAWYLHWKLPEPRTKFPQGRESVEEPCSIVSRLYEFRRQPSWTRARRCGSQRSGRQYDHCACGRTMAGIWGRRISPERTRCGTVSARVPLIFAGPSISANAKCTQPAELLDMYPTLLELCNLPPNTAVEGLSLMPQLLNAETQRARPAITTHNHDNHGIRSERFRYIVYADGSEELYDMHDDPNEWDKPCIETGIRSRDQRASEVVAKNKQQAGRRQSKPDLNPGRCGHGHLGGQTDKC